jgi:hypothetical protein
VPKQKFPRGAKVKVNVSKKKTWMSHFTTGFTGIVEGTYSQLYGGNDVKQYSVFVLDDKGVIVNCIAWYDEDDLTLVKGWDRKRGVDMIEQYEFE